MNLLKNPSFEEGWTDHPAAPIQIPNHWEVGYSEGENTVLIPGHENTWYATVAPEMVHARIEWLKPEEQQLFGTDGVYTMKLFGYHKAVQLWLWQPVDLIPGARYLFTMPVFVDCYTWDKENKRKIPPNLHPGEPEKHAAKLKVGISGDGEEINNTFSEHNVPNWHLNRHILTWGFTARSGDSDIVIEFYNPWPIQNNGWFFDGLSLEQIDAPPEDECEGQPREQYARVYNVIPQDTAIEDAVTIFAYSWERGKETVGGSYDDAGLGALDNKKAVLWNIPNDEEDDYIDFFDQYYPRTQVEFAYLTNDYENILLNQCDERWKNIIYADGTCYSLCAQGCWITCTAMAQRYYGIDPEATPVSVDKAVGAAGYNNCMFLWEAMKKCGLEVLNGTSFKSHAIDHLEKGGVLFIEILDFMHFVLGVEYDVEEDDFVVLDPLKCSVSFLKDLYSGAKAYRLVRRCKEIVPEIGCTISFHEQSPVNGLTEYVERTQPGSLKLCHCPGEAKAIHSASPDTLIVFRKVYDAWHEFIYGYPNIEDAAVAFIDWLNPELEELESIINGPYAVEGLNETIATGATDDIKRVVEFECYFAYHLVELFPNARPVLLNTAVGNPQHGSEAQMLIPAARAAIETNGFIGYHAYWPAIGDKSWLVDDWKHYAGRWSESWDVEFRNAGLRPHYLLTEGGPIGGTAWYDENEMKWKPCLNAGAGWRHPNCLKGNWDIARMQILQFDALARATVPGEEGRYHGIHLFTVGGGERWKHFAYTKDQFDAL